MDLIHSFTLTIALKMSTFPVFKGKGLQGKMCIPQVVGSVLVASMLPAVFLLLSVVQLQKA